MEKIRQTILDFVEREYKLPENVDYETFDFVEKGFVDSMGMVQFVAILEDEFDIEFSADELLSNDFRTVGGLEKLIQKKVNEK
ncbi:acyl carrier protein [Candidatus Saccharibacteria bacterium]|nr:acyl carrier protein [Candidatus Saccharibacteria bacterium]